MTLKNIFQTLFSRILILGLNFALIIFSTRYWGSTGKGLISITIADVAIVGFFTNIFVGSSVSYFSSRLKTSTVLIYAYFWAIFCGLLIPVIIMFLHPLLNVWYLIGLSVSSALLSAHINLFVGRENIKMYNLYTVLQLLAQLVFIFIFIYLLKDTRIEVYFIAQILGSVVLLFSSFFQVIRIVEFSKNTFSKIEISRIFSYGWKTQFSAFIHFLSNRSSYYLLEVFKGISSVGIFSIGVAVSETVLILSRSVAVVLYSDVVNNDDLEESLKNTKVSLKFTFFITFLLLLFLLLLPSSFFVLLFGADFSQTKIIIALLSPGILALAAGNILGFYFSGTNRLKILNIKSIIGFIIIVLGSYFIIPKWGFQGASVVTAISNLVSSGILFWYFYRDTPFCWNDFVLSKTEMNVIFQKVFKKK